MVELVRSNLRPILQRVQSAHAGLLMQRGLTTWEEGEKPAKAQVVRNISGIKPDFLYQLAFDRWLLHTFDSEKNSKITNVGARIDGRLMTGLALGGTLETGVTVHHTYGMPMLAGSSVKGAVRAYAETLFSERDNNGQIVWAEDKNGIKKSRIDPTMQPILNVLFGADDTAEVPNAGYLVWHDAWWIPALDKQGQYSSGDNAKPFVGEIITVHHQKYYSDKTGTVEALDMESPIPNQQLAVQGSFYFVIEGDAQWFRFAKQLLENMLSDFGMGAKGAAGYGYFKLDDALNKQLKNRHTLLALKSTSPNDDNDPYTKVRIYISSLEEKELAEVLSKNLNKFMKEYDLDKASAEHCKAVAQIANSLHQETISSWATEKDKNKEKAFKFVDKHQD